MAAGTIDNNIGKLRAIFKECGRGASWNDELHLGNPAAHSSVKNYYSTVLEEQTLARALPSQAVPIFLDKLKALCCHLRKLVVTPDLKASTRFILARDLAFFSVDFFSGDRGSDLGRVMSADVLYRDGDHGYLFNQVFGKTLRGNSSNVFGIKPVVGTPCCPVANLRFYVSLASKMSIDLGAGFLFRVLDPHGNILDCLFMGSAAGNRLKKHLKELSLDEGETMHGFRSGCSITLSLLGISYDEVAKLVGWKSTNMAVYYCQAEKVMSDKDASSVLSLSALEHPTKSSIAEDLGKVFRDRNFLKGFRPLFS